MAVPLEVVSPKGEQAQIGYILGLVDKHKACGVVLGLPIRMDGSDSDQTKLLRIFADKLSSACPVPIFLQDERLSSAAAQSLLREAGMKRKQRDALDDKIAARIILETVINGMLG